MDTLTHSLIGALSIRTGLPNTDNDSLPSRRQLVIMGACAAMFPDIDYASMPLDTLSFIADWHRGPTHSLIMLPLWALLLGWLASRLTRHKQHLWVYALVAAIALCSHILTDVITAWGTRIFWPLSDYQASIATSFLFDPLLSGIVLAGLVASLYWNRRSLALAGLVVLLAYIATQGMLKLRLESLAEHWAAEQKIESAQVVVLPQPLAPFNWSIIVMHGDSYHVSRANILLSQPWDPADESSFAYLNNLIAAYRPTNQLQWKRYTRYGNNRDTVEFAQQAWAQEEFVRFRRFAHFPVLYRTEKNRNRQCAWFADLRYIFPAGEPPFKYGMCKDNANAWQLSAL